MIAETISIVLVVALVILFAGTIGPVNAAALIGPYNEPFANRDDKAKAIFDWFRSVKEPKYADYKRNIKDSNGVEYEDILELFQDRNLTLESVKKSI